MYTTKLLNCHRHQNEVDAVCRSTVNLAFLRLAPKITRIQKIQQGNKIMYISKWQKHFMQKQRYQLDLFHLLHIVR